MSRRKRRWYTAPERAEMWGRWQRGESLNAIARAFETIQYKTKRHEPVIQENHKC